MAAKLFIVCPFSNMEAFLQSRFGVDAFFLSYPGASLLQAEDFDSVINYLITEESIRTIYLVNDADCRFIKSVIEKKGMNGLPHEQALEELYIEHYFSCFKDRPSAEQQFKLAELNVNKQVTNVAYFLSRLRCRPANKLEVKGLVTIKENNILKEIIRENPIKSTSGSTCMIF
ncbi:hypothetical protein [Emticicia sp. 21SJ11W-3]|uniref:hypothetical protein n=1 Tax=Emticicia sp. 21SJ11W-3 TaxID=2916755 RepID=UPI0020A181EB|nr:hypothetical protein [Emticicia sp. 21SJ11W-3]UTA67914.1 hypothetical protein MB380_20300 [Emticicia sp. 21SJ11W-3]